MIATASAGSDEALSVALMDVVASLAAKAALAGWVTGSTNPPVK